MSVVMFCLLSSAIMACFGYEDKKNGDNYVSAFTYAGGFLLVGVLYAMYLGGVFGG